METLGVESELRKAGVKDGHTVHIGEFELEWQD
jgi:Obg family GTPase CgtA-like protein